MFTTRLRLPQLLRRPAFLYLLFLSAYSAFVILVCPVTYTDTDLWIHLSGGKYFFEHHQVPHDSYFSFLSPPRAFLSYAWLFQALVYWLHSCTGYYGLIGLRAVTYAGLLWLIVAYLFKKPGRRPEEIAWLSFVGILCVVIFLPRYLNVRPYLFSSLFIAAFLYILEFHQDRVAILPALALLWANLHGVAYPILLLICGAYALEYLMERFRGRVYSRRTARTFFVPLVLAMLAIYLTPLKFQLLKAPFRSATYLKQFVSEYIPFSLKEMSSFRIAACTPSLQTFINILLIASMVSLLICLSKRTARISHLLMFTGGLFLLLELRRFVYEFALLSLPLLAAHPMTLSFRRGAAVPKPVSWVLGGLLMVLPFNFSRHLLVNRPAYPFSATDLPQGVATFLTRIEATGKVLNEMNSGGYLRWRLYPTYRIFMDMDSYFLDDDFYMGRTVFVDRQTLRTVLARYDPSFITVTFNNARRFKELIQEFPDYVLVFFDDAEVLYLNRRHYPVLAEQYALHALDPFELVRADTESAILARPDGDAMMTEARRLLAVYPEGGFTNYLVALLLIHQEAYDRALPYVQAIIKTFPEVSSGYALQGDAYRGMGLPGQALASYTQALKREKMSLRSLYWKIGLVEFERQRYSQAYRALAKGVDVLSPLATIEQLYQLGVAASLAGKTPEAKAIFVYLKEYRISPEEIAWREKVETALAQLGRSAAAVP